MPLQRPGVCAIQSADLQLVIPARSSWLAVRHANSCAKLWALIVGALRNPRCKAKPEVVCEVFRSLAFLIECFRYGGTFALWTRRTLTERRPRRLLLNRATWILARVWWLCTITETVEKNSENTGPFLSLSHIRLNLNTQFDTKSWSWFPTQSWLWSSFPTTWRCSRLQLSVIPSQTLCLDFKQNMAACACLASVFVLVRWAICWVLVQGDFAGYVLLQVQVKSAHWMVGWRRLAPIIHVQDFEEWVKRGLSFLTFWPRCTSRMRSPPQSAALMHPAQWGFAKLAGGASAHAGSKKRILLRVGTQRLRNHFAYCLLEHTRTISSCSRRRTRKSPCPSSSLPGCLSIRVIRVIVLFFCGYPLMKLKWNLQLLCVRSFCPHETPVLLRFSSKTPEHLATMMNI